MEQADATPPGSSELEAGLCVFSHISSWLICDSGPSASLGLHLPPIESQGAGKLDDLENSSNGTGSNSLVGFLCPGSLPCVVR